jgi:M6 family metalloprotease-like protein
LRQPTDDEIFDPPPHNKAYFAAHLEGLREYWGSQSGGRLVVNANVLPEGKNDAYFLSDLEDYGPGSGGFWDIDSLVKLVQDMVLAADDGTQADGSVNLANFDFDDPNSYLIFAHAGSDIQSNLVFAPGDPDYSPNDIPTFFVQLGDEDVVDLTSVDSDSGAIGQIRECSVIPETTSQDGLLGSIAAALYHEFGHALGLPDLYSTGSGLPTLGWWDVMDSGTNLSTGVLLEPAEDCDDEPVVASVIGLLPPSTSVWCKWYLGWIEPTIVGGRLEDHLLSPSFEPGSSNPALLIETSSD